MPRRFPYANGRHRWRPSAISIIVMRGYPSLAGLAATYSSKPSDLVPSAQGSLTAEFGMGSGSRLPAITTRPAKDGYQKPVVGNRCDRRPGLLKQAVLP